MARRWTLETARALFPEVRERTAQAVAEAEPLLERREAAPQEGDAARRVDERLQVVVGRWARQMEALGCEARAPWRVDFDTGAGCYCWEWPEEGLEYFHSDGPCPAGRSRLQ